jgi:spore germination protein KC
MPLKLVTVALIGISLLLSGCFGGQETESVAYILTVGIDKTNAGQTKVTYQIAVPKTSGGGGDTSGMGGKGGEEQSWIINTIVAPTPAETRMLLNASMSRLPNVSHTTAFIFGERTAREGIGDIISFLIRDRDYRESMLLVVVRGTAEDYIRHNNPRLEPIISKYYEIFAETGVFGSYFARSDLHEFYVRLKTLGATPIAMYSGINSKTGENKPAGPKTTPEQVGEPYLPGGMPRAGTENSTEFLGMALFDGDRMVGSLNSDECRAMVMLQGKFQQGYVGVVDPLVTGKYITLILRNGAKPRIMANLNNGAPIYTIALPIEGEIIAIPSGINYEVVEYRELLETEVTQMVEAQVMSMLRHTQDLGCDPVGFGMYLRPKFKNYNEMQSADFSALYRATSFQVAVTTKIRRAGLGLRTTPILKERD